MVNGVQPGTAADPSAWRAPVHCPTPVPDGVDPSDRPVLPTERPTESEAGILVQAYSDGNAALEQSHRTVRPACDSMVHAYWMAETEIEEYQKFASIEYALDARQQVQKVARRHADDGPEDRRHRPKWLSPWLIWPVFVASALYDTVFIGDILQQLIDAAPNTFPYYAAYFPGLGIMVGLLLTAHLMGVAHARRRTRLERRRVRVLLWGKRERGEDDLPWPMWTLPVLFGLFVLGTLGAWALIRATLGAIPPERWDLSKYHLYSAVLLLLLSITAIGLRVVAHNPFATSDKAATERMDSARAESEALRRRVANRMADHAQAWAGLQAALGVARSQAERFVDVGRARILELREMRAAGGRPVKDSMTPMTIGLWRVDESGEISSGPQTVDLAGQLRLRFEVLDYATDLAERLEPEKLERRLAAVDEELRAQFAPTDRDPQGADEPAPRPADSDR